MDFIFLRHVLPKGARQRLVQLWNGLLFREQTIRETHFYRQFVSAGDLVFDIGANEGIRVEAFLRLGAKVIAVEPNQFCVDRIARRQARAISDERLLLKHEAVGAERGKITFYLSSNESTVTSASLDFISAARSDSLTFESTFSADVITTDDLVGEYGLPAFIKIDVEGMDQDVLRGLHHRPRALSFEFNTRPLLWPKAIDCLEEAGRLGFAKGNFTGPGNPKLVMDEWTPVEDLAPRIIAWAHGRELVGDVVVR